jgi:Domain of unknown function (DUF4136)
MKNSLVIGLLALTALLSACSTQPVVTSQTRVGTELSAYKTYAFKLSAGKDAYGNASIASAHLKAAIHKEMSSRGYTLNESNPDILLDFNASMINRPKKSSGPTLSLGMFGSHGGVSLGVPVTGAGANSNKVSRIFLELVDVKRAEVVWEGAYEGAQSAQELADPSLSIYKAVHSIFSRFPIK